MIKKYGKSLAMIALGSFIYVIGINYFIVTANIFSTGLMGLAQEFSETVNQIFDLNMTNTSQQYLLIQTIAYWFLNLPAIILGYKKVGIRFTTKTLICSFIFIPFFMNNLIPSGSLLLDYNGQLTLASQILSAVFGGALTGLGMGIIFKYGASSGGTDIVATYLALFKGKSFGIYNLMINFIVMAWSVALFRSIEPAVLLLILIFVQSRIVDFIYNFHDKVTLFIITSKEDELRPILTSGERTYTKLDATSGYLQTKTSLLLVVINKEEVKQTMTHLKQIDESCFIDVVTTSEVYGNFVNRFKSQL